MILSNLILQYKNPLFYTTKEKNSKNNHTNSMMYALRINITVLLTYFNRVNLIN